VRPEVRKIVPDVPEIQKAEGERHRRKYQEMSSRLESINSLSKQDLYFISKQSDQNLKQRLAAATRIQIVGLTSWAQEPEDAPTAYTRLDKVLNRHKATYEDHNYQQVTRSITKDILGNPVHYPFEELRDSARLCLAGAEITGNTEFLNVGIAYLDKAITYLEKNKVKLEDPTVEPLLRFEKLRAQLRRGDRISLLKKNKAYKAIFNASLEIDNYERAATVTAWAIADLQQGEGNLLFHYVKNFGENIPPAYDHILSDQVKKRKNMNKQRKAWEDTRKDVPEVLKRNVEQGLRRISEQVATRRI
jgi:hypothetical protein